MQFSPIALFTYNRAEHTRTVVESLLQNAEAKDSDLYVFSDGAKTPEKQRGVDENREYIHTITGFKTITIIEREKNWGLANSLISGITEIVNKYGKIIVVEDDLIVSPYFLQYMNEALEKYKDEDRVASISAFLNPVQGDIPSTFFLRYFACWGWATWKRGWEILINDDRKLLKGLRWKKNDYNIGGTGAFYEILYCDKVGLNDSWAARFYASQFLAGKLQLFPGKTLVKQNGTDGTGTHSGGGPSIYDKMEVTMFPIVLNDIPILENTKLYYIYSQFYAQQNSANEFLRRYNSLKSFIRRLLGIDYK